MLNLPSLLHCSLTHSFHLKLIVDMKDGKSDILAKNISDHITGSPGVDSLANHKVLSNVLLPLLLDVLTKMGIKLIPDLDVSLPLTLDKRQVSRSPSFHPLFPHGRELRELFQRS